MMKTPDNQFAQLDYSERLDWFLLRERTIIIHGEIDEYISNSISKALILLSKWNSNDINVILNSPGGSVDDGLLIVETIDEIKDRGINVNITVYGICYSMGLDILLSGSKRIARPYSRFMIHDIVTGDWASDRNISNAEDRMKEDRMVNEMLQHRICKRLKMDVGLLKKIITRKDVFFGVKKALSMGIITEIEGVDSVDEITWD